MTTTSHAVIAWAIVFAGLLFSGTYGWINRYEYIKLEQPMEIRIDRWTGNHCVVLYSDSHRFIVDVLEMIEECPGNQ